MNEKIMRKHYETTPKEILIDILISARIDYDKMYYKNKEYKQEIERLNNIINEFEDILKRDIKACDNKFENMFDRNYRRLILEEKLEQLQELKGEDKE